MHPWWPHLITFPRFLDPISWLWLSRKGYAFSSSGLQLTIPLGLYLWYRRHQCSAPRCARMGVHPTSDGSQHLCGRHHPDFPMSLREIEKRHRDAKK